jgi:hypothetical protein
MLLFVRVFYSIATGLLLVGCHQRKPAMSDADFQEFKASYPGMTKRCLDETRYGGMSAWRPDDSDCFAMLPAHRWSGLWEKGWEWTNFCPDPAKECDWMAKRGTWLTFAKGARSETVLPDGTYRIEFVGRRSKVPGNFGHQASYDHLMVVDRVISIQRIPGENYTER